jgi:hypothetical protein
MRSPHWTGAWSTRSTRSPARSVPPLAHTVH